MKGSGHEGKSRKGKQAKDAPSRTESAGEAAAALCERITAHPFESWADELEQERNHVLELEAKGEISETEVVDRHKTICFAAALLQAQRYSLQTRGELVSVSAIPDSPPEGLRQTIEPFLREIARLASDTAIDPDDRREQLQRVQQAAMTEARKAIDQLLQDILARSRALADIETDDRVQLLAEREPLAKEAVTQKKRAKRAQGRRWTREQRQKKKATDAVIRKEWKRWQPLIDSGELLVKEVRDKVRDAVPHPHDHAKKLSDSMIDRARGVKK